MVVGDIDLAARNLPQRADAEIHAVAAPALLLDLHHGNAGGRTAEPGLEPAYRLLATEAGGNGDDKRCLHGPAPLVIEPHIIMPAGTTKVPCKLSVHPVFHWRNFKTCGKLPSHHGTGCKRPFNEGLEEISACLSVRSF